MTQFIEDRDRQVVPRWRSFAYALKLGELDSFSIGPARKMSAKNLRYILADWREEPGVSVACDFISAAFSVGHGELAEEAACFVLAQTNPPTLAAEIASRCLSGATLAANAEFDETFKIRDLDEIKPRIGISRHHLRDYPKNPALWTNLSLMFTIMGEREKAEKAMKVAIGLAPNDRFIVRAACRFYLHQGDFDLAHKVLTRSEIIRRDPWVVASEIAVSQAIDRPSGSISTARRLLASQNFSPFHISELAGALATTEAKDGNIRKAKRLCIQSLIEPAENAIAQAAWLERNIGGVVRENQVPEKISNEADAWTAYSNGNWTDSLAAAKGWQLEQPFSSRPAILGSFIASAAIEDFELAVRMVRVAYASNGNDVTLLNNLAFAHVNLGNLSEAQIIMRTAESKPMTAQNRIVLTATKGFIAFRSGHALWGRQLYRNAIASCGPNDRRLAIIAELYLALEEQRLGTPEFPACRAAAITDSERLSTIDQKVFQSKITALKCNSMAD